MSKEGLTNLINQILDVAKTEEVIGDYVDLQRKGNNYVGLCPFHSDSNPSMSVSPDKKIFKCFSCGAGGNVITFVQNHEGISFIDAVKKLSERYDIDWKQYIDSRAERQIPESIKNIWAINHEAALFYKYNLENELLDQNSEVIKYIASRNISKEDINTYQLGFAKPGTSLLTYLTKKGFEELDIIKAGLAKQIKDETVDYFYNRLLFAIHDSSGNIIGFSGRQLGSDSKYAKYLNTPETQVFQKGKFLYNFHRARSPISLSKKVYIVEGYMDVISLGKYGINNVVATMGTAFTEEQSKIIRNSSSNNVVIAMDSDIAGINAAISIGKTLVKQRITNLSVFRNTITKDTDELVNKLQDKDKILSSIEKGTIPFIDFYRELLMMSEKPDFTVIEKFVKFLANIPEAEASYHINIVCEKYGIVPDSYYNMWRKNNAKIGNPSAPMNQYVEEQINLDDVKYAEDIEEEVFVERPSDFVLKQLIAEETEIIYLAKDNQALFKQLDNSNYQFRTNELDIIYWALKRYYSDPSNIDLDIDIVLSYMKENNNYSEVLEEIIRKENDSSLEDLYIKLGEYIKKSIKLKRKIIEVDLKDRIDKTDDPEEKKRLLDELLLGKKSY